MGKEESALAMRRAQFPKRGQTSCKRLQSIARKALLRRGGKLLDIPLRSGALVIRRQQVLRESGEPAVGCKNGFI